MNLGQKIFRYQTVTSTNEVLKGLASEGFLPGTAVISAVQTSGRGRLERTWESPEGGLWLSVLLDADDDLNDNTFGLIPLMTGCAVTSTIKSMTGLDARVKWPNDVLIGGRKVCGILGELIVVDDRKLAVVGIGLNVNNRVTEGYEFSDTSTSLVEETGRTADLETLERVIFTELDARLGKGNQEILDEWRSLSDTLGRRVRVITPTGTIEGMAEGIDEAGALVLLLDDGKTETVLAGDCQHC